MLRLSDEASSLPATHSDLLWLDEDDYGIDSLITILELVKKLKITISKV